VEKVKEEKSINITTQRIIHLLEEAVICLFYGYIQYFEDDRETLEEKEEMRKCMDNEESNA
jgi:hypothetical protein